MEVLEPDKTRKMEFDFICPFVDCNKAFKRSCDLMVHFRVEVSAIKIKTDVRPFECPHCGKTFRRKILLNKHLARMSCLSEENGEKSRSAEMQQGADSNSSSIPSDRLLCHSCWKEFKSGIELYQHVRLCSRISGKKGVKLERRGECSSLRLKRGILQIAKSKG